MADQWWVLKGLHGGTVNPDAIQRFIDRSSSDVSRSSIEPSVMHEPKKPAPSP
jgi:hypothetical protein